MAAVASSANRIKVPPGYKLHTENSAHILLPDTNDAFLNPVQEFNRDLSVASIRVWAEERDAMKKQKWLERQRDQPDSKSSSKRRKLAGEDGKPMEEGQASEAKEYDPHGVVILEALSATGLRSIRYAKEIPQVKYVLANDLSPAACQAMRQNVDINGLGAKGADGSEVMPKVRVNEGDACTLMYSHRALKDRVDVVDLDPYGTAAPFLDAAVQAVRDDGLLCVTCTDLAVLASGNYPEKCFSNYGGVPVRGEYCHESSLRLVLNAIATAASRYGRSITPLLSLSIDFYVRLFVRVKTNPTEVKKLASKTATYYICTVCQSHYEQPLGRIVETPGKKGSSEPSLAYKTHIAPVVPQQCPECDSSLHMAGPMWRAPLHDVDFVKRVLAHVEQDPSRYGTSTRIKGMLTVASEELTNPFYFTPSRIAGYFRCEVPSLAETSSALLNGGYQISRSHALGGSLKTTAPRSFVFDIMREWVKTHPVKMENVSVGQIARTLLEKPQKAAVSFDKHPNTMSKSSEVKLVRYQTNPTPNWGPKPRAKRKRETNDETSTVEQAE
ncbi:hypothetical protein M408DRAFT_329214 [Serendipita vermifera MAFF 305830]|uniref:tRNA (guanine(26)-N(2))-dimethyltransferase n=1 Tax=Serendipita vermifera MAFF 305830 TaxID=933852 RepID=A0A0C2WRG5_SERVB|nr:hypothetical protein M408DRAFT_329214 [Serendipita vermifera MAFF 305830]